MNKKYFTFEFEQLLIKTCKESQSMAQACAKLNINHNTFIKHAKRLDCYNPNPSGKGIKKYKPSIPLFEILQGLYPQYQSYKLLKRLIKEKIKEHKCEICNNIYWNNKLIPIELHHINGNRYDHHLKNLQIICPNCHAQTINYKIYNYFK